MAVTGTEKRRKYRVADGEGNLVKEYFETSADQVVVEEGTGLSAGNVQDALKELKSGQGKDDSAIEQLKKDVQAADKKGTDAGTAAGKAQQRADAAYSLAEGRSRAFVYDDVAAMTAALKAASATDFKIGDNLLIKALNVPDYWVSGTLETNTGTYGYYEVSELEGRKLDLTAYQTKNDSTLPTTAKTVVGAIGEVKTEADETKQSVADIVAGTTKVPKATNADEAAVAVKLKTKRAISLSGDATGSADFDGSAPAAITVKLKSVGTPGTYSCVTTDAQGRVSSGGQIIEWGTKGQTEPSASLAVGGLFMELVS